MSETDRQTVCRKLDTILQGGTAEPQSLYLDAGIACYIGHHTSF